MVSQNDKHEQQIKELMATIKRIQDQQEMQAKYSSQKMTQESKIDIFKSESPTKEKEVPVIKKELSVIKEDKKESPTL